MELTNWKSQLAHWNRATLPLNRAMSRTKVDDLEVLGVIHIFSFNLKLALKTLTSFCSNQDGLIQEDPKNIIRIAFSQGLIKDSEVWMDMLKSQNNALLNYDDKVRYQLFDSIVDHFYSSLTSLQCSLNNRAAHD